MHIWMLFNVSCCCVRTLLLSIESALLTHSYAIDYSGILLGMFLLLSIEYSLDGHSDVSRTAECTHAICQCWRDCCVPAAITNYAYVDVVGLCCVSTAR